MQIATSNQNKQNQERLRLSSVQMHDVRNQVQSLSQFFNNIFECNQNINLKKDQNTYQDRDNQNDSTIINLNPTNYNEITKSYDTDQHNITDKHYNTDNDNTNHTNITKHNITDKHYDIKYNNDNTNIIDNDNTNINDNDNTESHNKTTNINENTRYFINQYQNTIESKIRKINLIDTNNDDNKINLSNHEFTEHIEQTFGVKKITNHNFIDFDIDLDDESILIQGEEKDEETTNEKTKTTKDILKVSNHKNCKQLIDQNIEIQKLIDYIRNPEHISNLIKFVNQNISFLQHMDLTFERKQQIKLKYCEPSQILSQLSKMMKILFINKQNEIELKLESQINVINIDIKMLKQLICQLGMNLHENNNFNFQINLTFQKQVIENTDYLYLKIESKVSNQDQSKNILLFKACDIFKNIISNLGQKLTYTQCFNFDKMQHEIIIQQKSEYDFVEENDYHFNENTIIKNDTVKLKFNSEQKNNLILNTKDINTNNTQSIPNNQLTNPVQNYESNESKYVNFDHVKLSVSNGNLIFVNIDDEVNILSMHSLICSKLDIQLNCFATDDDLKNVFLSIYSKYSMDIIQPLTVLLIDHVLDRSTGLDLWNNTSEYQRKFKMQTVWILLSSTEDIDTIEKYKKIGFEQFIEKPLSKNKIQELVEQLTQRNYKPSKKNYNL